MTHSIDLDDYSTGRLQEEIARRTEAMQAGKCPYCRQPMTTHTCKYKDNVTKYHSLPPAQAAESGTKVPGGWTVVVDAIETPGLWRVEWQRWADKVKVYANCRNREEAMAKCLKNVTHLKDIEANERLRLPAGWVYDGVPFVSEDDDCNGNTSSYWKAWAKGPEGMSCGIGATEAQALTDCKDKAYARTDQHRKHYYQMTLLGERVFDSIKVGRVLALTESLRDFIKLVEKGPCTTPSVSSPKSS